MNTSTIMTPATASRSLSGVDAASAFVVSTGVETSWFVGLPAPTPRGAFAPRHPSANATQVMDVVPTPDRNSDMTHINGTGITSTTNYNTKQDRPPRGAPR